VLSKVNVLLTVFFEYRGIVHHSYAPEGQTINTEYYLEVIRHLRDAVTGPVRLTQLAVGS
jgi:hypothetical protein